MKGRILGTLFALPFAGVGAWMLYAIATTLVAAYAMQDWQPVEAQLVDAGYHTRQGDDSTTWEAYAEYRYTVSGRTYYGDRVAIAPGGDNIGDYQRDLGRRLERALANGETTTVWVNPDDPSDAIVDRRVRWGLIGFKAIFVLVFGGVGAGLLFVIWRAPADKDETEPRYRDAPWLLNTDWQTPEIRSSSKMTMYAAWGFAAIWSLISAPLPFVAYEEVVDKENYLALAALLFPIVGVGLIAWAIRRTLEWRRFGAMPVVLDPFPGSIGGHVGGTIDTSVPYAIGNRFVVTLTNLKRYYAGSGKNRSRREKALWQDEIVAHTESGPRGTRVVFRFDVPDGLDESDAKQSGERYHAWKLNVRAELPNTDVDRDYDIPVYATATTSRRIADRDMASNRSEQLAEAEAEIRDRVRIRHDGTGKTLVYPMGRHFGPSLIGFLTGAMFAGAGYYLATAEQAWLFGLVFGGVGALIALASAYMLLSSLEVGQRGDRIVTTRRLLGIPVRRREMRRADFYRFEKDERMQTQAGGKHTIYYRLLGIDRQANEVVLGEGFRGEAGVQAAISFLSHELGLRPERVPEPSIGLNEELFA